MGLGSLNAVSYLADYDERAQEAEINVKEPLLSVGALIAERDGWRDFVGALRELAEQRDAVGNVVASSSSLS